MDSHELANKIVPIQARALQRIMVEGDDSYNDAGEQRFEKETMEDNLIGLEEELLDTMNWAAMAIIKLRELRRRLAQADSASA